jgi:hypothetical protein
MIYPNPMDPNFKIKFIILCVLLVSYITCYGSCYGWGKIL